MQHITGVSTLTRLVAEGDPEKTAKPIFPALPELVFGIIVFGLFLWIVWKKVVPNLEKAYRERTAAIEGGMQEAEEAQREAEQARVKYEEQLAAAHTEANKIREDARAQGASIIADAREQAGAEAGRITESAHRSIEAERQQAAVSLRGDVGRISTDLASRIVGESLHDETRQKGIVERFLAELESGRIAPEKATASGPATAGTES